MEIINKKLETNNILIENYEDMNKHPILSKTTIRDQLKVYKYLDVIL